MINLFIIFRNYIFKRIKFLNFLILFFSKKGLLTSRIWGKIQPIGKFKLSLPDGNSINYYAMENDQLARSIIWTEFKDWEFTTVKIFCELSSRFNNFIDVGSYSGIYSIINLCINDQSEALIFEPNPDMIKNIKKNLNVNNIHSRGKIFNLALSNFNGKQSFAIKTDRTSSCLISNDKIPDSSIKIIQVKVDSFDELNCEFKAEIVKIDVEGNELNTLKGMNNLLIKNHPILIIECLTYEQFTEIKIYLTKLGYSRIYQITLNELIDTEVEYIRIPGAPNVLCIPESKAFINDKIISRFQKDHVNV